MMALNKIGAIAIPATDQLLTLDYEYRLNEEIIIRTPKHKLSSHTARRTFIVTAMNEGVSLDIIALITSHADIEGMKKYIKANRRGTDAVIDAIDNITSHNKEKKNIDVINE